MAAAWVVVIRSLVSTARQCIPISRETQAFISRENNPLTNSRKAEYLAARLRGNPKTMVRFPLEIPPEPQRERRDRKRSQDNREMLHAAGGFFLVVGVILVWVLFFSVLEN